MNKKRVCVAQCVYVSHSDSDRKTPKIKDSKNTNFCILVIYIERDREKETNTKVCIVTNKLFQSSSRFVL